MTPSLRVATFAYLAVIVVSSNTAALVAQPAIGVEFGAGAADVAWVVFGFGLTFAVGTALWPVVGPHLGLGPTLAAGVVLFSMGSALAALAPSLLVLIGARAIQGLGAGAVPTLSSTVIAIEFDGHSRARALGAIAAAVLVGVAIGPLVGGVAEELIGWQAAIAFGVAAAPTAALVFRYGRHHPRQNYMIDGLGVALVMLAAGTATFALNRLPIEGWSLRTAVSLGVLALTLLIMIRRSDRPSAFIPRRIVATRAFGETAALGALTMAAFMGTLVLIPLAAARVHGLDGLPLALPLVPLSIAAAVASMKNATFQERLRPRRMRVLALLALAIGAAVCGTVGAEAPTYLTAVILVPLGLGFGLLQAPLLNELTLSFDTQDRPVALGLYNLIYFVFGAAGAALATAFVQGAIEAPIFAGRELAGFSTALVLLAGGPALGAALVAARPNHQGTGRTAVIRR